jgi:transcriptional regulator with XRE-family HTH domain
MGRHEYGKRSPNKTRKVISRAVPAIISEAVWNKAQETLRNNFLFGRRSARNQYLLRGMIKCGVCGRTYIGIAANRPNGKREFYYRCNGSHSPSIYAGRTRCHAKPVRGDQLEQQVWSDVESFLRHPDPVLQQLHARLESDAQGSDQIRNQLIRLEDMRTQKAAERSRVVAVYRRGRLTEAELDGQLEEIGKEEIALDMQIAELRGKIEAAESINANISSAQALLGRLRRRLDEPVSWDLKRRLIEVLVAGVRVETVESCGVKHAEITVTYRFTQPGEALPLVVPQSYSTGAVIRIPAQPQTVGDHIRRRRLALKMLQREVADQIGVDKASVFNWEANTSTPEIRYMPAIIRFLGYNPLPEATRLGERLIRERKSLGLSQEAAAKRLGVDPSTLARWEQGKREPTGLFLARVNRFLADEEPAVQDLRRVG